MRPPFRDRLHSDKNHFNDAICEARLRLALVSLVCPVLKTMALLFKAITGAWTAVKQLSIQRTDATNS